MPATSEAAILADSLKRLKNKKTFLKKNITILNKLINSNETPDKIIIQFDTCERIAKTFENLLEDVFDADDETAFDEYFEVVDSNELADIKSNISNIIQVKTQTPAEQAPEMSNMHANKVKLPILNLPTYSGSYDEWLSFRNSFMSSIGNNVTLSGTEKLQYLKAALKGDALNVIKYLDIEEGNYAHALALLIERFENKRIIINTHIRALFEINKITKESHQGFRQILNTIAQHLSALETLNRPVQHWDDLLVYLITTKIPSSTHREWQERLPRNELATLADLKLFITNKCHSLEASQANDKEANITSQKKYASCNVSHTYSAKCPCCNGGHYIYVCEKFLKQSISDRIDFARKRKLCLNCLRQNHDKTQCKSLSRCRKCNEKHNSLLHIELGSDRNAEPATSCTTTQNTSQNVLLSTAVVQFEDIGGSFQEARILLDSGSQVNLMTNNFAEKLGLNKISVNLPLKGINNAQAFSRCRAKGTLISCRNNFSSDLDFYLLDKVTNQMPAVEFESETIHVPSNLRLADPLFFKPAPIDALLGAEIFFRLLMVGQFSTNQLGIVFQKSSLGWLISGKYITPVNHQKQVSCNVATFGELNQRVQAFWEVEQNLGAPIINSDEEKDAEVHFKKTIQIQENGRFQVSLPWKGDPRTLGDSFSGAEKRLLTMERKFIKNNEFYKEYSNFMKEYEQLGHMRRISDHELLKASPTYYLPHHAVLKADSTTTKLRVVFDASFQTTTGKSLNDLLMVGPTLQEDVFTILFRFRTHQFVLTSDIAKMYRQIQMNPEETKFQRILWRTCSDKPIDIFELLTITYGTCPASFLATRCLQEIAQSIDNSNQQLAQIIRKDFYMDDLLTGGDTINEVRQIQFQIKEIFSKHGFELRKWASNDQKVLKDIASTDDNSIITFQHNQPVKTLGVRWVPNQDIIQYHSNVDDKGKLTKRLILSCISSIFDPLGLVGPTVVMAKMFMQRLWRLQLNWDEAVPQDLFQEWKNFTRDLNDLNLLKIPRKVIINNQISLELHGFCDASEKAYGACVYLVSRSQEGNRSSFLVASKSRVAPIKVITLARLELCGALLLAQLMTKINQSIHKTVARTVYYTDSMITLSWIRSCSSRWKTFVSHRVGEIQTLTDRDHWRHVAGSENPADMVSRGLTPSELKISLLWWHGPQWIIEEEKPNFVLPPEDMELPEARTLIVETGVDPIDDLLDRFSSYSRLLCIAAWCKRFAFNCKHKVNKRTGGISVQELWEAEIGCIRHIQEASFSAEKIALQSKRQLHSKSRLLCLNPFIDKNGLIRVGGRLSNSALGYDTKHPWILPDGKSLTKLIIRNEHERSLHAGIQTTLTNVRQRYWPLAGKGAVRKLIHKCIVCFRARPVPNDPIMGNLPCTRVQISRPFLKTGVDYFGPIYIKEGSRKSKRIIKCYGSLFICMATRAIHKECVSDLTTSAFFAALQRFVSRRGYPEDIFSDNGTNFVGADNELEKLFKSFNQQLEAKQIQSKLLALRINWHFNPPRAPHFGGLWESAVKGVKHHIKRIVKESNLTFEEMSTLLSQIEAIVNSRPLCPLSNDPNDFNTLTPGHFLIGSSLTAIPEPSLTEIRVNRLSRWQRVQQLTQSFWQRWSQEFLTGLQSRTKWVSSRQPATEVGQLVVVSEDN